MFMLYTYKYPNNLNNLVRELAKEHLSKTIFNSGQYFYTRRCMKFLLNVFKVYMFLTDQNNLDNLGRGSPKELLIITYIRISPRLSVPPPLTVPT